MMTPDTDHLHLPVMTVARKDFTKLRQDLTVQEALDSIRRQGLGEPIVYFYAVDDYDRLTGVLPTRRLLTSALDRQLAELMITRVIAVPQTATVMDACDLFILHKFLALPVVDEQRRIVGLVDVGVFAEEVFDVAKREQFDAVFETIGFRVSQVRDASPLRAFRFRFPWLTATIGSGTLCALLASGFEVTLAKSLVLAFFLTLVLGLGESVSIQSMTVTIQALRSMQPTFGWYVRAFRREACTAIMLGTACGGLVGLIAWLWRGQGLPAVAIAAGILMTIFSACFFGLSVPVILHAFKLDLKISAGPITLALTDIFTLLFYFSVAAVLL
jgi:magnesium transporter